MQKSACICLASRPLGFTRPVVYTKTMTLTKNKTIIIILGGFSLVPVFLLCFLFYGVIADVSKRIERGTIDQIIASESPVYYDDGQTPIGVFFEKTHRKYIHYGEIPKVFIKALIASEDRTFFTHKGVDVKSVLRALIANIRSGKVVQGGSTITQQTAKNIFKREKRSYRAKLKELIQAFLLEKKYTKEEIIEMYANQFFVTGYGKGLGIAAQCFFDKEAKGLDLVEAAFIAGSVKGPNRYNPFIKKNDSERNRAIELANDRKNYVLRNMFKLNYITKDQYLSAKGMNIPFKEGKITYRLNVILDYIREQLGSDFFQRILKEQGVDNVGVSGIKIHTSINREIQEAALTSIRTHLPLMEVQLNGYSVRQMPDKYRDLFNKMEKKPGSSLPVLTKITQIDADGDNCRLVVSWKQGGGIISYEGIKPVAEAWLKWKGGSSAAFTKKTAQMFLNQFRVNDMVPVQILPKKDGNSEMRLMLSLVPELDGGLIVLQNGQVKAMVGGFLDRFFNRAVDAKRQLGSIFKPLVYTAALQLKWNSLDPLMNSRNLFQFENTFYVPNADHTPDSNTVSMVWAGAKSENLATVWLLYHLTDHLNLSEFRQVVNRVGLHRVKGESYLEYKKRIRDEHGVVIDTNALREAAFRKSIKEVTSDIIFGGHADMFNNIKRLHFRLDSKRFIPKDPDELNILRFSFERLQRLNMTLQTRYQRFIQILNETQDRTPEQIEISTESLRNFYRTEGKGQPEKIIYTEAPESLSPHLLVPMTFQWIKERSLPMDCSNIWVDGLFTSKMLDVIQNHINENLKTLMAFKRYDMDVLFWIRDFKTLVNLSYVAYLSKQMGIHTKLAPVLSFPLGPNSISISEAALAYQAIMTGQVFPLASNKDLSMIPIITKIVDREGEALWEYDPRPVKVLSDRVSGMGSEILRKVMEIGTGKKAGKQVRVSGIPIPSFGKTGTANRFTNSSFVGFLPGPNEKTGQLDLQEGYVIAGYVGYDDNRPMKGEHVAIYGASGAMPIWIDTAKVIVNSSAYQTNIQPADLIFDPASDLLSAYGSFPSVRVSSASGLPMTQFDDSSAAETIEVIADVALHGDTMELKRVFEPMAGDFE